MAKRSVLFLVGLVFYASASSVMADIKVTGFSSMVGGIAMRGEQYLADYPNTGVYDENLSFAPDTTIGIQLKNKLSPEYEAVMQLLSRGTNDFTVDIDWAYLNYSISPETSLQIGRKRLPLYFYSDFYELGFAYHWIRPPADNYTWQITNYTGFSLIHETELENWDALFMLYFGHEKDKDNQLLGFLSGNGTVYDETWKNMIGFVSEFSTEQYELRFTIMSSVLDRDINGLPYLSNVEQLFYGFSFNVNIDSYILLSEFNRYERPENEKYVSTYMISLGYKIQKYTPHFTYSEFKQTQVLNGGDEFHFTYSLGLRRELNKSTALKIQYDKTTDKGVNTTITGDGELLSFGLDFVF
ncbi:MAG: hypothetical protein KAQ67_04095 [Gammaproteobacteria bacterium]|nr:hypothetical protein [Gammaproteobacteria bacterium]